MASIRTPSPEKLSGPQIEAMVPVPVPSSRSIFDRLGKRPRRFGAGTVLVLGAAMALCHTVVLSAFVVVSGTVFPLLVGDGILRQFLDNAPQNIAVANNWSHVDNIVRLVLVGTVIAIPTSLALNHLLPPVSKNTGTRPWYISASGSILNSTISAVLGCAILIRKGKFEGDPNMSILRAAQTSILGTLVMMPLELQLAPIQIAFMNLMSDMYVKRIALLSYCYM